MPESAADSDEAPVESGAQSDDGVADDESDAAAPDTADGELRRLSTVKSAAVFGIAAVVVLATLAGWFGLGAWRVQQNDDLHRMFLHVGRQGAVNLTTIDYTDADADVARIIDSSTGSFRDDFQARAQPFVQLVKQAQSVTEGTVTEAGVESVAGDVAQVLVAVSVKTTSAGVVEERPRAWRMRIAVQKMGDEAKVSNVELVT